MEIKQADIVIYTNNQYEKLVKLLNDLHARTFDCNILIQDNGSRKIINPNKFPKVEKYIWYRDGDMDGENITNMCVSPIIITFNLNDLNFNLDLSGLNLLDCIRTKNPFNRCLKPTLKPKDIDVCITTYNRKCDLEQTLNEFAKQKGTNFNVLVNDDGSKELLDPYMFSVLDQYMWTKDIGFTKVARVNESVQMCPSELILMLDDDAIPIDNDFLRKHVFYLQEADVTFGRVVHSNFSEPFVRCPANLGFRKEKLLKNYGIYYPEYNGHYGFEDTDLFNEIRYLRLKTIKINAVVKMNSPNYSAETRSFDITRNGKILTKRWNGWRNIYWRAYEKWIRIWETISPVKTNTAINE